MRAPKYQCGPVKLDKFGPWSFKVICNPVYIYLLLCEFQLKVKFNGTLPTKFIAVKGGNEEEVQAQKHSYNLVFSILQWLRLAAQRDVEEIPFAAFNQSCIGVHSDVPFKADLFIKSKYYFLSFIYIFLCHNYMFLL